MDSEFMDYYIPALKISGGYNDIYESLDSADLADVVRVAVGALDKAQRIPAVNMTIKSANVSNHFREQGNVHYENGEHKKAILRYNMALAVAPFNSLEMKMAYSNTSAVTFAIKAYKDCRNNIEACLELGCPQSLKEKLERRKTECNALIGSELAAYFIMTRLDKFINEFFDFKVRRNTEVPCASDDVSVINIDGMKKVVAARDIKAGTMVAMERAFVSTLTGQNQYTSCYYCHFMCFVFVPCKGCHALFCSLSCQQSCMEAYHRIECQILNRLRSVYEKPEIKLMTRAAIKMSLELGWKELSVSSREIGTERLKKSTVKEAFDVSNPLSILSYDDQKAVFPGKIFNGSIICGLIVRCLSTVPDYFPEDPQESKEAIDAMSRIMLHLYATFTNRIEILCSALDMQVHQFKCGVQRNLGWFSFTSKLAHSCEPNLYVLGLNDEVALVALQRIKKGEELTISYVGQFYDMTFHNRNNQSLIRQKQIVAYIRHLCECRVCVNEWDADSHIKAKTLTYHQKKTFDDFSKRISASDASAGFKFNMAAITLDSLTGLTNTTEHKMAYDAFGKELHMCQYVKVFNKTYERSSYSRF